MPAGRLARLGATRQFHHGLLTVISRTVPARVAVSSFSIFIAPFVGGDRALSAVAGSRAIALRFRPTLGASA